MDLKEKILNRLNDHWSYEHGRPYTFDEMADFIVDLCQSEMHNAVAHWTAEIDYHKDKIAELELDSLLHDEQAYGQPGKLNGAMLNIKKRGNFR